MLLVRFVGINPQAFSDLIRVRRLKMVTLSLYFLAHLMPRWTICQTSLMMRVRMNMRVNTVMPLRVIGVSLFPVWKWNRGQVLFKAI